MQEIIVNILILAAVIYALVSFAGLFKTQENNPCGCSSSCSKKENKGHLSTLLRNKVVHSK